VIAANEISGTLSMYEVATPATLGTGEIKAKQATFNIFPNPVNKGNTLYFNRKQDYELYDMSGKLIGKEKNTLIIREKSTEVLKTIKEIIKKQNPKSYLR